MFRAMIIIVAHNRGMSKVILEGWKDAVIPKMNDVGVNPLREFIVGALGLNSRLERARHQLMHRPTL
jgi:hypothetical protein